MVSRTEEDKQWLEVGPSVSLPAFPTDGMGDRTKADRLVEESKVLAAAKLKATERRDAFMASSSLFGGEAKDVVFSAKDRERLEKRYREIRGKTRDSLKRLLRKWEEE